ncbi:hypothetical protein U6A24_01740 [Aquimarina gracilis]|uniref:Fibronectin type-III domain-containing protein n=1 Tax=Aquimarina gracilis TaxID=874422 RepID=A0ABU5ZPX7_9FLAO|nr:hypothetical protein [Aquimarina gracilis]MEB3344159.1 hypothetical protein [Aquimarina gracilis]
MRILKYILIALVVVLQSCGGSDDGPGQELAPTELGAFDLTFPDNNEICSEGVDISNTTVEIPFRWTASENATSYTIEVTDTETGKKYEATTRSTSGAVILPKGTPFTWKVTATASDKTKDSNAERNFYSEGISTSNHIPFPALITLQDNKDGTINILWEGSDLDNDIDIYEVYIQNNQTGEDPKLISTTKEDNISNVVIDYGTEYSLEVITKDLNGNSSSSKKTFKFRS